MSHTAGSSDDRAEYALRLAGKQALRERMQSVRRVLPKAAGNARSAAICERLSVLSEFTTARTLVGYAAFGKEADPKSALGLAERAGKQVGLVRVAGAGALTMHAHHEGAELVENELGILEPRAGAQAIEDLAIDLIVVPVLAVDERGYRVGYGHGYYDRLLARLPRAYKVAVAYDFQLMCEIPNTPGDLPVDCVVTDRRVLLTRRDEDVMGAR